MSTEKYKSTMAPRFLGLSMMFSAALLGVALTDSASIQFFFFVVMAALLPLLLGLDKKGRSAKSPEETVE
ncbi:hypothetical protein AWR36_008520 [Microbulbifer flavimaris]|uniref:Uncharacterized protein n=1 Tax=Microbulbifer flavimaris TaxID=1781068 RepID=A0ABX4I129_9GAMM|nr:MULTISPECIES: hypothetical protein [Microbulbifer]KUJ83849.1 hypothetical protein AVO43_08490 [Microbulbifer sp. ZGT114]PCO06026.1 hypothetical protein AWR36_008520 [Microbulbifer flavimaris]